MTKSSFNNLVLLFVSTLHVVFAHVDVNDYRHKTIPTNKRGSQSLSFALLVAFSISFYLSSSHTNWSLIIACKPLLFKLFK